MKKAVKNIKIPETAKKILSLLEENGFSAYIVGGYVRDLIREADLQNSDIDIATNATPNKVEHLFESAEGTVYPLGKKYGTIGFRPKGEDQTFEITTYRTEQTYSDGRHPDKVSFADTIEEDLSRRDFTCNAIALNLKGELVDPFGGIEDIHNKVVRAVGDAHQRFEEDHLRILRALRFASQLGFEIEETTASAVRKMKDTINSVSSERLREELTKLICGKNAKQVLTIYSDVIFEVIPELKPLYKYDQKTKYHSHDAWEHTLIVLDKMPRSEIGRWAALLHDMGKPKTQTIDNDGQAHYYGHPERSSEIAEVILKRLKFSKKVSESVLLLIKYHDRQMAATKKSVKKMLRHFAEVNTELPTEDMFRIYCDLRRADSYAHDENFRGYLTFTNQIESVFDKIIAENEVFSLKDLDIGGKELMELGVPEGPKISEILNALLESVIDGDVENKKPALLASAKNLINT